LIVLPLFQANIKYLSSGYFLVAPCLLVAPPCTSAVRDGREQQQDRSRIE
jgi:hypothetical protein